MWVHEIKHDGYRLIVRRADDRVRLLTRRGYDWTKRFPRVVDALTRLKPSEKMRMLRPLKGGILYGVSSS